MAYCDVMEIQVRDRLHSVVKLCDDTVYIHQTNSAGPPPLPL